MDGDSDCGDTKNSKTIVMVQWETPKNFTNPETWINLQEFIDRRLCSINSKFTHANTKICRLCDCCGEEISMIAENMNFRCIVCSTKFDMCDKCQEKMEEVNELRWPLFSRVECPKEYGCRSRDSNTRQRIKDREIAKKLNSMDLELRK